MKKLIIVLMALALVAGFTGVSMALTIVGTDHDLSGTGGQDQICIFCHTPHNADTSVADAPLWNHALTTQTFTPYTSSTLDATVGQPDGISKLCLSCHDGVTFLDAYGTNTGSSTMGGTPVIGLDLRDDHPISFTYDDALATLDGGLWTPSTANSGLGGSIAADMLFSDKLECGSCHAVHDNAIEPFLRLTNAASALCLTCHDK